MTETMTTNEYKELGKRKKVSKYRNKRVTIKGERFDSKAEARRWSDLSALARAEHITDLHRQVPFSLEINCVKICKYIADFTYMENGAMVVEDVKGVRTDAYKIKKKLMRAIYGIEILEIAA